MKPTSFIASIFLFLFLFYAPQALNLKLESSCGLESADLEVEVFNPPGGYLSVNPDLSVSAPVPAGTKLSVLNKPTSKNYDIDLLGPWTPAA